MAERTFGAPAREKMASKGTAMPDGSFPIPDKDALRRAVQSFGRAPAEKKAAVKAHILKRARALGAMDVIPDGWGKVSASQSLMDKIADRITVVRLDKSSAKGQSKDKRGRFSGGTGAGGLGTHNNLAESDSHLGIDAPPGKPLSAAASKKATNASIEHMVTGQGGSSFMSSEIKGVGVEKGIVKGELNVTRGNVVVGKAQKVDVGWRATPTGASSKTFKGQNAALRAVVHIRDNS